MATVVLPRSLVALFPGLARRQDVAVGTVASVIDALDGASPGLRDRLVESGPRLRPHINVYVAGRPADLTTPVAAADTVHVIPAVSGGAGVGGPGSVAGLAAPWSVGPRRWPPCRRPSTSWPFRRP